MTKPHLFLGAYLAALLMLAAVPAGAADVKQLFTTDLADYPGKEARLLEVSYPPGGRNASDTESAKFLVVLLKAKGAPVLTPVKE